MNNSYGEFKKEKPHTFDREVKYSQEAEAWILGMRKYFRVQDYYGNMNARVAIFNLNRRASIWWEHLRKVKKINDRKTMWKQFKKYFKQKYLSDRYYDDKIREFHELRLGQLTMEEYENKFLEMLRYVRYIRDDKMKIHSFLSGIPQQYKDRIEFDELRTLEEAIRKEKYFYDNKKKKTWFP